MHSECAYALITASTCRAHFRWCARVLADVDPPPGVGGLQRLWPLHAAAAWAVNTTRLSCTQSCAQAAVRRAVKRSCVSSAATHTEALALESGRPAPRNVPSDYAQTRGATAAVAYGMRLAVSATAHVGANLGAAFLRWLVCDGPAVGDAEHEAGPLNGNRFSSCVRSALPRV